MDTLQSMRVFRLVAELKSFAAAANRLGISPAMASKHVMHLEEYLSARLLHRTSRSVSPTETGVLYLEQLRQTLDNLEEVEAEIGQATAVPRGVLKICGLEFMGTPAFVSLLSDYQSRYPNVQISLNLSGWTANFVDQGFDLAIRLKHDHVPPSQPGVVERPLMNISFHMVAASAYLDRVGRPKSIDELNGHHLLIHNQTFLSGNHSYDDADGTHTIKFVPTLRSDNLMLLYEAAIQGMGVTFMPKFMITDALADNRLELLLPELARSQTTICGVYPSRKYLSAKVRTFLDFVAQDTRFA